MEIIINLGLLMNAMNFVVSYIVVIFLYNDTISAIIIISLGCTFGQPTKKCSSDICDSSVCTNYPNAVCYPDKCANCSPRYFIENNEITNACGKFLLFIINFKQYIIWYTSIFLVYILIINFCCSQCL